MFRCIVCLAAIAAAGSLPAGQETELRAKLPEIFAKSAGHYKALDAAATPLMKDEDGKLRYPHGYIREKGKIRMNPVRAWTAGHFPGSLWYLYEATGDGFLKDRALAWTEILVSNAKVTSNHDVGFIMYCSYGNARRLMKTDRFDAILAETAESLSVRFNGDIGLIRSWGKPDEKKEFLVIPDNMMNLELLEAVSKFSGNGKYAKIARSHADVTMKHHFRADGGTYHVLNYDQRPGFVGRVQEIRRGQGASCETAWSRGQSWAIYGYTMMYRETGDARYLAFAQKLADFAIGNPNMPEDGIPCWDYGAPGEERDSSAGSIMASALMELSSFVPGEKGAAYRAFAVKQLLSLASPAYFSEGDEIGHFLLKHGVGSKPSGSEVDVPLNYGDYYFLEALLRFKSLAAGVAAGDDDGSQVLHPSKPKISGDPIGKYPVACTARTTVAGEAPSLLPDGHEFKLVWSDEFNGDALDMSKWSFRTNFWGRRAHWFAAPEDGCVEVRDGVARLKVKKLPNGQFVSPQLQTGGIMWDIPPAENPKGFWPLPGREKPKFVHRYGYYECRLRLQRKPGWWSAFWMQTEMQGCCLDAAFAGIEHDIMESFYPGDVGRHMFHYDGYGPDYKGYSIPGGINDKWIGSLSLDVDEFHTFGLLWEPDGYTTFVDGRRHGEKTGLAQGKPVSQMPEFILISTECMWYRKNRMTGKGEVAALEAAVAAGDCFTVDFVRVYDIADR